VRRLAWANEVLYELECVGINIKEFNAKRLLKFCNSIEIDETDGLEYLRDFFNILSNKFEFNINVYPALQEHYDAYFESAKVRIKKLNEEGMEFIGSIDNFKKVFSQKNGVTISTCHGVKGTEYDTVIAFGLLGGYIPHFADKNGNINANKLLYVVCSRARKNLHLIAETERFNNWHPPKEYEITPNLESYCYCYDEM
jgi:superfamily I DNA/RNA helicase